MVWTQYTAELIIPYVFTGYKYVHTCSKLKLCHGYIVSGTNVYKAFKLVFKVPISSTIFPLVAKFPFPSETLILCLGKTEEIAENTEKNRTEQVCSGA